MKRRLAVVLPLLLLATAVHANEVKVTLKGSRASMQRQNRVARELEYSFLRTKGQIASFALEGYLVPLEGSADYHVLASYPYARPAVRTFVKRLAAGYRAGCGEPLVVTSLTRPAAGQPRNASPLSVHPAGMAVDLRVSRDADCVRWLQAELLELEEAGLLDATREYYPPHFHVAVFPETYETYAAGLVADSLVVAEARRADSVRVAAQEALRAALPPVGRLEPASTPAAARPWVVALLSLMRFMLPV